MGSPHQKYAENPENFRQLDQLLAELPSMEEVLAKARSGHLNTSQTTPKAQRPALTPDTTPTQRQQLSGIAESRKE